MQKTLPSVLLCLCLNMVAFGDLDPSVRIGAAVVRRDLSQIRQIAAANPGAINRLSERGHAPLHLAIAGRAGAPVIEALLSAGANPNLSNRMQGTPLTMAVQMGHAEGVECLLRNGARPDLAGARGMTPLHWAVAYQDSKVGLGLAQTLLNGKADPDVLDKELLSPFHRALLRAGVDEKSFLPLLEALLKGGADANKPMMFDKSAPTTPLKYATQVKLMRVQALLQRYGAK